VGPTTGVQATSTKVGAIAAVAATAQAACIRLSSPESPPAPGRPTSDVFCTVLPWQPGIAVPASEYASVAAEVPMPAAAQCNAHDPAKVGEAALSSTRRMSSARRLTTLNLLTCTAAGNPEPGERRDRAHSLHLMAVRTRNECPRPGACRRCPRPRPDAGPRCRRRRVRGRCRSRARTCA